MKKLFLLEILTCRKTSVFDSFLYQYDLSNLVKECTCYKNPRNPSCIDLCLTNSPLSFQNVSSVVTGLSDFHKLILTVLKTTFVKSKPKELSYRDCKSSFDHEYLDVCIKHF